MQQLPLVDAEVQRIGSAFGTASQELSGAVNRLGDLPVDTVGTPSCDAAVSSGLRDLRTALARLQATAEECVAVLVRHSGHVGGEELRQGRPT